MKKSYIIGAVILIAALAFAMVSFKSTLTSYVTIEEAMASEQNVQVAGLLVPESTSFEINKNLLVFTLQEQNGDSMVIHYQKSKPANFENAEKIVAIGKYDKQAQVFHANELLVKCPSKYEGKVNQQ